MKKETYQPKANEVSVRAVQSFVSHLKKEKLPVENIFVGLPFSVEYVKKSSRWIEWEDFVRIIRNFEQLVGKARLERVSETSLDSQIVKVSRVFTRFLSSPKLIYKFITSYGGPVNFPIVKSHFEDVSETQTRVMLYYDKKYTHCPQFFKVTRRAFEILPETLLKLPKSTIEVEMTENHCVYLITHHPSVSIIARVRRAFWAMFAAKSLIEEFGKQTSAIKKTRLALGASLEKVEQQDKALRESSNMAALGRMAALGQMAAGFAHEINNPLAIIQGNVEWVRNELKKDEALDEDNVRFLKTMESTVGKIARIVEGLRHLSSGDPESGLKEVFVKDIVEDCLNICRERFRNHGIQFEVSRYDFDLRMFCNPTQISEVLINLLNNAHDAIERLDERWIVLDVHEDNSRITFSVTDSGKGIDKEVQRHLYEPFYTTKPIGKGTGLGLSLSKEIVEKHGGKLVLDGASEHTRFVIDLPIDQGARL